MNALRIGRNLLAIALASAPLTAQAEEPLTLRIGDYLAASHYLVSAGIQPWMDEVTATTHGAVKFEYFPAQQLGKATDFLKLTQANVAQVTDLTVVMAGDKLLLSGIAELPGLFDTACQGEAAYRQAAGAGPIAEQDFAANKLHLLFPIVFRSFQLFTRAQPVTSLADVKGLKLMIPMRTTENFLRDSGAVTIAMQSGPDTYQAMQRGTIDGYVLNPESVYTYDLQGMTKTATQNGSFGQLVSLYVMNAATWNKLDTATRKAMDEASNHTADRVCKAIDGGFTNVFTRFRASGMEVATLPPNALAAMNAATAAATANWVADLDKRGRPGTEVLNAIRAAAAATP